MTDPPPDESAQQTVQAGRSDGPQSFSFEQAKAEIRVADAEHRRREQAKDNRLRRLRDGSMFVAVLLVALVMLGISLWVGIWSGEPEATKQWARSLATLIVGGFVGYITGRSTK